MIAADRAHYSFEQRSRWRMMWTRDFTAQKVKDNSDDW